MTFSAPAIALGRVWVAAAALGVVVIVARPPGPRLLSHDPGRCVAAGLVLAVHWTSMFGAYQRAPDDTVIFIIFLAPIAIASLAPRTLGETVGGRMVIALVVAVAGFVLIAAPQVRSSSAIGLALAVVSGAFFVALVLLAQPLATVYGGLRLTFIEMVVAGIALLPTAIGLDWARPASDWAWLAVLGLVHTGLGTALYLAALARTGATATGILGYLEPVGVVLFAWLIVGHEPRVTTIVGGGLIVVSGALVIRSASALTPEVPARVPW